MFNKKINDRLYKLERSVNGGPAIYSTYIVPIKIADSEKGLLKRVAELESEIERLKELLRETVDYVYGDKDEG